MTLCQRMPWSLSFKTWNERGGEQYAGIIGLDFYADKKQPIGGYFPENLQEVSLNEISEKGLYKGDAKQVMRSDLTRTAIIEEDFHGEKDFNPYSMVFQAANSLPLLVINDNLCFVDYQPTGMAANIYKQYLPFTMEFHEDATNRNDSRIKIYSQPSSTQHSLCV